MTPFFDFLLLWGCLLVSVCTPSGVGWKPHRIQEIGHDHSSEYPRLQPTLVHDWVRMPAWFTCNPLDSWGNLQERTPSPSGQICLYSMWKKGNGGGEWETVREALADCLYLHVLAVQLTGVVACAVVICEDLPIVIRVSKSRLFTCHHLCSQEWKGYTALYGAAHLTYWLPQLEGQLCAR